ncbi:MFS general substrate transporter [Decorospora gaudefroyi]|uniref:MFS general substrate transporter n=1 Tax=Decorospora gaudefroyi TaxID=184978 RepID=A0A6A5L024_9PLEO|nr:MFS general substrate transporter [Decorospora gaudefroyi]
MEHLIPSLQGAGSAADSQPASANPPCPPITADAPTGFSQPSQEAGEQLEDQTSRLPFARLMAAYMCLCLCYFTSYLDMNAVTTALPTIAEALDAGPSITWAGTAYLLGQTTFQPLYGRLSDITGRKPILLVSVTCIITGGLLCGFARSPSWLYAARALSGVGGGGISSLVAIIVSDLVSLKERGKYQGMVSLAIGAGATVGPFAAASLVRYPGGWRWTFWLPSILAACCLILLLLLLPLKPVAGRWTDKVKKIDWPGMAASVSGIVLLLIPINSGGSIWPWRSVYTIPMIIIGGLCLIAFALYEGYLAKLPIMPWRLFQRRSPAILLAQGVLHDFVWQTTQYFVPLYLQTVRDYTPMRSATLILPFLLAQSLAGASSGPIMSKLARYGPVLRTGFLLWSLGAGLKLVFSRTTPLAAYVVILAIEGAGVGLVHQPGLVALQALSQPEDRAVATSTRNLLRSLGGVTGVAVSTALQYGVSKVAVSAQVPTELATAVMEGRWRPGGSTTAGQEANILDARMKGFQAVFAMLVPLMALCLLGSFFVSDEILNGDENRDELPTPAPAATNVSPHENFHTEKGA